MRELVRAALAGALAFLASGALARTPELPRELRGRLTLEVSRCRPLGRDGALLEARVRLRAAETEVSLPGLHCGAFDEQGEPLFLAPVHGALRLPARTTQSFDVRLAADAQHWECGCTVRDVRNLERAPAQEFAGEEEAFDAFLDDLLESSSEADSTPGEDVEFPDNWVVDAAPPLDPPALRFERVLAPDVAPRSEPSARAEARGALAPGARVAVDRIERGWKLVRSSDGQTGWIPGDASTPDVTAPERMGELLAPLHGALAPTDRGEPAPCASVRREALTDLVLAWRPEQRAVYLRPLWYALAPADRNAFQIWAAECFDATRLVDGLSGRDIRALDWEGADAP